MEVSKILIKFLFKNQLFCIIGISLFFRLYYYQFLEPYTLTPDSITYYEFRDSSYRTPIYPFFIKIITFLFGRLDRFNNIVFFQELISIFTIILFYKIAVHYLRNKVIIILSTLFYGCSPIIISSTRYILTESLSLSFFIIYFYFIIEYLKRPSNLKAFIVGFFPIFLIMIRPSFLFIIPLFLFFLLLRIFILKKFKKLEIYIFVGFYCLNNIFQK
jgi:4-amino-4-deoxy-L-arabinose transferase-like glycosyltransferase